MVYGICIVFFFLYIFIPFVVIIFLSYT
jgi:hypothetical protein